MVDVILPVLDEAAALPGVLARIPDGFRPLVVDNGSRDGSGSVARSLGARTPTTRDAWPWHARLANRALACELRRRWGIGLTDLGPMRAARRDSLLALGLRDRAFGWPLEMVLRAAAAGWLVSETSVSYGPRAGGRSKVSGSVRGTWRAVRDMGALLR